MNLFVTKDNQRLGPFTLEEARKMTTTGQLQTQDWAWYEGLTEWIPLSQVPGFAVSTPAIPLPPPSQAQPHDPTLFIRRLVTAAIVFGLLFVIIFLVAYFLTMTVGGAISGLQAHQAHPEAASNFDEGYKLGREAGRHFALKYGGLILFLSLLVSFGLSILLAWLICFSNLLPWCKRRKS